MILQYQHQLYDINMWLQRHITCVYPYMFDFQRGLCKAYNGKYISDNIFRKL